MLLNCLLKTVNQNFLVFIYRKNLPCDMFWKCCVLVFLLAMLGVDAAAQKILLLEKTKGIKRIRLYEGDPFAFRVDGDKYAIRGNIELILDYGIVLNGELYRFESITMALNYKKYAVFRGVSKSALSAIPSMLVITALHRGINTKEQPLVDENALYVTGAFAGIGLAFWPFKARKYRLQKKWQLRTLDITPG
jgi:hypothetical protein